MTLVQDITARGTPSPLHPGLDSIFHVMPNRTQRQKFCAFVADNETAAVLEAALGSRLGSHSGADRKIHVMNFSSTLNILSRMASPEILLVDLSGEDQPINAISDLAEVVESGTTVLAIGQARDLGLYRALVNGMGIKEYFVKPLSPAIIADQVLQLLKPNTPPQITHSGSKLTAICGTRGGIGTTTIAANLAWVIGHEMHRHAMLLDSDFQTGTAALALNVEPSKGLFDALMAPERLDGMLLERVAQSAGHRLRVIAGQETLANQPVPPAGAAAMLVKNLRSRYKFIIADTGAKPLPFARELFAMAEQRVIVLDPSIMALRNLDRLRTLPGNQTARDLLVLNQAGRPYGLSQAYLEQKIGAQFDIVIPDLPRLVPKAEHLGDLAAAPRGPFRNAIIKLANMLGAQTNATANLHHALAS